MSEPTQTPASDVFTPVGLSKSTSAVPPPALPHPVGPGALRASHADREAVAQVLNQAMADGRISVVELQDRLDVVYAAKTVGELEPITQDLPGHLTLVKPDPANVSPFAPAVGRRTAPAGTVPDTNFALAIFSGAERRGQWIVPETFNAVAIMGGVELDLSEAYFTSPTVTINVTAIMGGVDITVDETTVVRSLGVGIMGGFDRPTLPAVPSAGAPVLVLKGLALMGGVTVKRRSPGQPGITS